MIAGHHKTMFLQRCAMLLVKASGSWAVSFSNRSTIIARSLAKPPHTSPGDARNCDTACRGLVPPSRRCLHWHIGAASAHDIACSPDQFSAVQFSILALGILSIGVWCAGFPEADGICYPAMILVSSEALQLAMTLQLFRVLDTDSLPRVHHPAGRAQINRRWPRPRRSSRALLGLPLPAPRRWHGGRGGRCGADPAGT